MEIADEIVAAGGVVIEQTSEGALRVLVVHRPHYDDWSLPKGKLDAGETIIEAALREVKEETGLDCRILSELAPVRYEYSSRSGKRKPKVVHYFLMEPVGGQIAVNQHEIDAAEWVDRDEAARRLTYSHDKELLAALP
jgi:8-oxo-dGTP pyrophosphatase MutT (NUDIX family)